LGKLGKEKQVFEGRKPTERKALVATKGIDVTLSVHSLSLGGRGGKGLSGLRERRVTGGLWFCSIGLVRYRLKKKEHVVGIRKGGEREMTKKNGEKQKRACV